jgi:hypothetical protein
MIAYLTFLRKNKDYLHLLGIKNPTNIISLQNLNLTSGQPVIVIIKDDLIISLYYINENGELFQSFGQIDYLFQSKNLLDFTYKNVRKYNYIRNILIYSFMMLSIEELDHYSEALEEIENTIFHNYLHLDIDLYRIKYGMIKLLNKSGLNSSIKERIIKGISKHKIHSRGLLKKKIDINLSGYLIKINSFVS